MNKRKYKCKCCHKFFSFKDIKEHTKQCISKKHKRELEEIKNNILPKVNNIKLKNEIVCLIARRKKN